MKLHQIGRIRGLNTLLSIVLLTLLISLATLPAACSSKPKPAKDGQALSGTDEQIFIGDTIEKNYDPNVIMKRAEAFFDKEDFPEAIIEYQHFLDLHRVHALAPYAQSKLAESHFKLFKTIDRDPEPVYKALEHYQRLLKEYPGSRYELDAVEKIRICNDRIAQAYFFVGQFYYRREAYLAAAHRFEAILDKYPDMGVAPEAVYYLALTYKEIGATEWARDKLEYLASQYPNNKYQEESHELLAQINKQIQKDAVAVASSNGANGHGLKGLPHLGQPPTATASLKEANADPASKGFLCRVGIWCR